MGPNDEQMQLFVGSKSLGGAQTPTKLSQSSTREGTNCQLVRSDRGPGTSCNVVFSDTRWVELDYGRVDLWGPAHSHGELG